MRILRSYGRPFFWLILYLLVLVGFGLTYINTQREQSTLRLTGVTGSLLMDDGNVSITPQGFGLAGLPAYLALDPSNRRAIVGNIPIAGNTYDVEVVADKAYVVSMDAEVRIFDLSNPTAPERDGNILARGRGWRINADANSLYLSSMINGLWVYPLSEGGRPYRITPPGETFTSVQRDQQIFIAEGTLGLAVYEISSRSAGVQRGRLALPGNTVSLTFFGSSLVAASRGGGLHLIDISDSANPRVVQTIAAQKEYELVTVVGDILYASDRDRHLELFSLSDGHLHLLGSLSLFGNVRDFLRDGSRLYLAESSFGVSALDISDPAHPQRIGFVGTPGQPNGLALYGDYLYVASSSQGVQIVDKNRFEPQKVAASFDTADAALDIVLDGRWVYVADSSAGLQVIDRSDPDHFRLVAALPTTHRATKLVKVLDTVFILLQGQGLIGVDVSDPLNPKLVSQLDFDISLSALAVRGSTLFASSYGGQLLQIDISDPRHPWVVDSVDLPGRPRRIALAGDDVFVAAGKAGLLVVRFPTGEPGRLIASLTRPWPMRDFSAAYGVAVRGRYAYLVQGEEGLQVVDIRNPENPVEVDLIPLPGKGLTISLSETYVVVSTRWLGYYFIDISNPEKPFLAANIYLPRSNSEFTIEGSLLYATSRMNGINVVPLPVKNIGSSEVSMMFEQPQLAGWYDLSVSNGKRFVNAASVLKVE